MRRGRGGVSVGATMVRAGREGPGGVAALGPGIDESGRRQQAPTNYGPRRTRQSADKTVGATVPSRSQRCGSFARSKLASYWSPFQIADRLLAACFYLLDGPDWLRSVRWDQRQAEFNAAVGPFQPRGKLSKAALSAFSLVDRMVPSVCYGSFFLLVFRVHRFSPFFFPLHFQKKNHFHGLPQVQLSSASGIGETHFPTRLSLATKCSETRRIYSLTEVI